MTHERETACLQALVKDHAMEIAVLKSENIKLAEHLKEGSGLMQECTNRIKELESMIADAMKVIGLYINVPEAKELQERWEKIKGS